MNNHIEINVSVIIPVNVQSCKRKKMLVQNLFSDLIDYSLMLKQRTKT